MKKICEITQNVTHILLIELDLSKTYSFFYSQCDDATSLVEEVYVNTFSHLVQFMYC